MKFQRLRCALIVAMVGLPAAQANEVLAPAANAAIWLSGSVGLMSIRAHEYVYLSNDKASQLDWDSVGVPIYSLSGGAHLGGEWHLSGRLDLGLGGDSHMVDYDWVPGLFIDQSLNGWSDRSIHPDTRLQYFFSGALEIGRTIVADENTTVSVGGGFKYTEVSWDAFGGSYVYSNGGFRTDIGDLPPDLKGISYRQSIPTAFVGFDGSTRFDRLSLSGGFKGGMTLGIDDKDDHWLNNTRVFGDINAAPVLILDAAIDYRLTETASITLAGTYENVFHARGDMTSVDTTTGIATLYKNAAGASIETVSLQLGLRGEF